MKFSPLMLFYKSSRRNLGELEEVRRRYRDNGYDAYNSRFPEIFPWECFWVKCWAVWEIRTQYGEK